jgi:hypothetical protein
MADRRIEYRGQLMAGIFTLIVISWVLMSMGTAAHASGQNKSPLFWGLAVLITGIFGLLFYAISLASSSPKKKDVEVMCNDCGWNGLSGDLLKMRFCPDCDSEDIWER